MRHDGRFVRDIMKMSPLSTAKRRGRGRRRGRRCTRRRAKHLQTSSRSFVHVYAPRREMHMRAHACARTPALHALSDGTDIRLRCQPIVKGTIRIGRTDQQGWSSSRLPVYFLLFIFVSSVLLSLIYACISFMST